MQPQLFHRAEDYSLVNNEYCLPVWFDSFYNWLLEKEMETHSSILA